MTKKVFLRLERVLNQTERGEILTITKSKTLIYYNREAWDKCRV